MPRRRVRNVQLRELLTETHMTAAELARAVNLLGRTEGLVLRYDRTAVAHWLAGSRPRSPVPYLVAEALTRRAGRLVSVGETGLLPDAEDAGRRDGAPDRAGEDGARALVQLCRTDTEPGRRSGLAALVYRQRRPRTETVTVPSPAPVVRVGPGAGRFTDADLARLEFMVCRFADQWARFGGGYARALPAALLGDDVGGLLAQAVPPQSRTPLMSIAAQLAYILGGMSADAGYQGLAQRYYELALAVADEGGDRRVRAMTLRAMSVQAARLGAARYAADLAGLAVAAAERVPDADLRCFVHAQHAHGLALLDERRAAYEALGRAEGFLEQASGVPGPFTSYPRAGFAYRKGRTLHLLGDSGAALSALRYAAERRAPHQRRLTALSEARVALLLLELGRVEEACAHVSTFIEHYPLLTSHWSAVVLAELQAALAAFPRVRQAAALAERLRVLGVPGT
ncbi:tol-pal system YbgF family protein [Streptomyces achromogenes]|uniref:tol-pal system YbgF family protein n=1 Tax=Streptomyces achromogenes TaxID=67255 RepID=UPI0036BCD35C